MAEQNYIGIAMGLDVTSLKVGLNEANKQIQLANSEFKAASSGMDDWSKSTEGLSAKVKQLDTVLDLQRRKLSGLQAEYDNVVAKQGENSEAARRLKIQINNQQVVVNKTEKEFQNYKTTLEQAEAGTVDLTQVTLKAGKAVDKLGDEAKESGSKIDTIKGVAGGVAKGLLGIAGAAAGGIATFLALGESTRETRNNMAKLEAGFVTAGLTAKQSTDTYAKLYGVLGDTGKATEATAMIGQMAKSEEDLANWTNIATGVYATFGDSLPIENLAEASLETSKTGKITGGLADALNWAGISEEEFQKQLDACTTEQERQKLITDTLTDTYSDASDQFKETNKDVIAAQEADAALTQAIAELGAVAEPIMTNLKTLATGVVTAMMPFVTLLGGGLTDALNGVDGGAEKMAEGLSGIITTLLDTVSSMLPTLIDLVVQLVPKIINSLLDALPQLLKVIIDGTISIIDGLAKMLPVIVEKIMEILPILINQLVAAVPQLIEAAITLLMSIVDSIPIIIDELLKALPTMINTIIDAIIKAYPMLLDGVLKLFMALTDAIPVIIDLLIIALPQIIDALVNGLIEAIPILLKACIQFWMALIQAIPTIILELIKALPKLFTTIYNSLTNAKTTLFNKAKEWFMNFVRALPSIISDLKVKAQEVINAVFTEFKAIGEDMKEYGKDVVEGLWNGIKDKVQWIKNKIKGFVGDVKSFFTDFFGIESPSKLMHDAVGMYLGEGIGSGLVDSLPIVKKDIDAFSNKVANNLGNIKSGLTLNSGVNAGSSSGGSVGGVINNFTQVINAPKQPSLEDLYRRTGNLLDLKGGAV